MEDGGVFQGPCPKLTIINHYWFLSGLEFR